MISGTRSKNRDDRYSKDIRSTWRAWCMVRVWAKRAALEGKTAPGIKARTAAPGEAPTATRLRFS
jgi:hypothetical protein